jgi:hypothetical protein
MKLFEIDADLSDIRDEVKGLVLANKAAGIMKVTPDQMIFDLRRSGHNIDRDELLLLLKNMPGISTASGKEINFAKTTPDEKQQKKDDDTVKKMSRSQLDRNI